MNKLYNKIKNYILKNQSDQSNIYLESDANLDLIPVVLSGGSGTRLWPLSRACFPKQYLNLNEQNKFSLLQNTFLRLKGLNNLRQPIIITNEAQRFIVAEQMREISIKPNSIILEPEGKNTAPAIALAALKSLKDYKDPTLLILSSDHKIEDEEGFRKVIEDGIRHSKTERLVTFGVKPNNPETGYGYIETFEKVPEESKFSKIKRFIEKPNLELAKLFFKDKHYLWNSGIFLFKASTILSELKKYEPELIKICEESIEKGFHDLDFFRIDKKTFQKCKNIPIDIAVMEKTKLGCVLSLQAGWDDIGTWKSVWENSKQDQNSNSFKGKVILNDSKNCYVRSEGRLIVGLNLKDLIIIETNDAILISDKNSTQKVRRVVESLNENNYIEGKEHKRNFRPWGNFKSIEKGPNWQVKRLEIKPKASISLQKHNFRSEHWIIVNGTAKIEVNEKVTLLEKNESAYIPLGAKHRLSNPGDSPLILIEVQSGEYLGEDDIIRFEDNYGRSNP